jgi:hypothetical protein
LTIKFTRSIADYWELSAANRVISCQSSVLSKTTPRRANLWRLPAHRTLTRSLGSRTPAGYIGTHKIYFALYLPNLFSCQISSSPACAG